MTRSEITRLESEKRQGMILQSHEHAISQIDPVGMVAGLSDLRQNAGLEAKLKIKNEVTETAESTTKSTTIEIDLSVDPNES